MRRDVFGAKAAFEVGGARLSLYRLDVLAKAGLAPGLDRLPYSI